VPPEPFPRVPGLDDGIVLRGRQAAFELPLSSWHAALALAREWGWEPEGTLPPRGTDAESWEGDYVVPAGQRLTEKDARRLGQALRRGAQRVPEDADACDSRALGYPQGKRILT
jgi:hypothetical protein